MKRTVWTFGLISGGILSAMMLLSMLFADDLGFEHSLVLGYTTMVVAFLLVFFGIRSYRDNVGGGTIGFGRAMAVGLLIVAVASVCYVATWELVVLRLAPDFMDKFQAYYIEQARAGGGSAAEVQQRIAEIQRNMALYRKPLINAAMAFVEPLPVGLVMTLVSAGILSRRRRREESALAAAVA